MFNFIPICKDHSHSLLSAKYCAKIVCKEMQKILPNINLIPPVQRQSDDKYLQYWVSVELELEKIKIN